MWEGERARKTSILPVVDGARAQFASNYEETDTTERPFRLLLPIPEAAALTPDGAASPSSRATPRSRD